jgi:recombination protein RecT
MATAKKDVNQQGLIKEQANKVEKQKRQPDMRDYVMNMSKQFEKALPSVITPERFTRIALTALSSTPQLMNCDRNSFLGALMQAAQLGLEPNTPLGQAYLIPFKNNKKGITECQFQIGYKGLIDLAYRSGDMASIQAYCVYKNDDFDYELGLDPVLKHKPAKSNRGKLEYVYAVFKLQNGGNGFEVMSVDDINQHARKYSQGFNSSYSPWKSNFDEMAKKTVLKRVLKYAPIKTDFQRAVIVDEHTISAKEDGLHDDIELEVEYTINDAEDMPENEEKDSKI